MSGVLSLASRTMRGRLEWNWGLGHLHLDEHLQGLVDPEGVLTDEPLLVFPPNDIIHLVRFSTVSRRSASVGRTY
ncbi:hypothetical protein C8R47DRAFT_1227786 [Mycena vitilis]|nr:hypothetical protein C8R47DRAFT_1227786 [Mycena vitilis]